MKVINLISRIYPIGGAQSVCVNHLEFQLNNNIDSILISGNLNDEFFDIKYKNLRKLKFPFLINFNLIIWVKNIYQIIKLIKNEQPDFIVTHSTVAGLIGRILGKIYGIKTIHTFHGFNTARFIFFGPLFIFMQKILSKITDIGIFVSSHDYYYAKNKNFLCLKNFILNNTTKADNHTNKKIKKNKIKRFVMVARHASQKDHKNLFLALNIIKNFDFEVDLIGGGNLIDHNKKLVIDLNLESKINFLGEINNVEDILPNYDCGLLISHMEGLPVSVIEYLKSRLIVLCSDVGGCSELVTHNKNGFLIKDNDPKLIASYMKKIIYEQVNLTEMKNNSYNLFLKKFSKKVFFKNLKKFRIYEK